MRALLLVVTALASSACDHVQDASSIGDGISSRGAARVVDPPTNLPPRAAGGGPQWPDECEVMPQEDFDAGALLPKHDVVPRRNHEDNI